MKFLGFLLHAAVAWGAKRLRCITIGAQMITDTIVGAPYYDYIIITAAQCQLSKCPARFAEQTHLYDMR